jgi:3-(3-hydroxy-phenyl)propionate hydroxylase
LRLAADEPAVRSLINPRQSAPVAYTASPLNGPAHGAWTSNIAAPGHPAPEALLQGRQGTFHLTQCFGTDFTCLVFGDGPLPQAVAALAAHGIGVIDIAPEADLHGQARARYGLPGGKATALVLVRPDGYVMGRWSGLDAAPVLECLRERGLQP